MGCKIGLLGEKSPCTRFVMFSAFLCFFAVVILSFCNIFSGFDGSIASSRHFIQFSSEPQVGGLITLAFAVVGSFLSIGVFFRTCVINDQYGNGTGMFLGRSVFLVVAVFMLLYPSFVSVSDHALPGTMCLWSVGGLFASGIPFFDIEITESKSERLEREKLEKIANKIKRSHDRIDLHLLRSCNEMMASGDVVHGALQEKYQEVKSKYCKEYKALKWLIEDSTQNYTRKQLNRYKKLKRCVGGTGTNEVSKTKSSTGKEKTKIKEPTSECKTPTRSNDTTDVLASETAKPKRRNSAPRRLIAMERRRKRRLSYRR